MFFKSKFVLALFLVLYSFSASADVPQDVPSASYDFSSQKIKLEDLPQGTQKLPCGLLVPPHANYGDSFYFQWEGIRRELFFLGYYGLRDFNIKKKKGQSDTVFLQKPQLIDTLNDITVKTLNGKLNYEDGIAAYEKYFESVCLDCIFEELAKDEYVGYNENGGLSPECAGILKSLKSKVFSNGTDSLIYGNNYDNATYVFLTNYEGTANRPSVSIFRAETGFLPKVAPLIAMPWFRSENVNFFVHNARIYYADFDDGKTNIAVFKFDKKTEIFKDVCRFTSTVAGWIPEKGKDNPMCQAVADKKYQTHETVPITSVIPEEEYKKFKTMTCQNAKAEYENIHRAEWFSFDGCLNSDTSPNFELASETSGTGVGLKIDYNNDGKDEVLMGARYASGSGSGCAHTLFRIYDSPDTPTRLITNGKPDDVYFHGGNTGDDYYIFCRGGKQEIVTVEGKNYLLTMDRADSQRLDMITTQADGTNKIEQLCSFIPKKEYQ